MNDGPPGAPSAPAARAAPLPAAVAWQAPAHWQAIDLISDLHLCEDLPRTLQALESHLRHTPADAVFVLGDLFEVWVGDDERCTPFGARCAALFAAPRRAELAFMVGNRDFLLGPQMLAACRASALPDPTLLLAFGQRLLLSHGDALCLDDKPYQAFRTEVRSSAWQQAFLARGLEERLAIARHMRAASEANHAYAGDAPGAPLTDVDAAAALQWLHAHEARALIHGHTHRPADHELDATHQRHVLTDWDLDRGQRAEVLRLSARGLERVAPARAA